MILKISVTRIGDRPIDGSSSMISFGADITARPMASICCSPPESVPASCLRRSFRRGKHSNTQSMSRLMLARSLRVNAPISRFSCTFICAKMRRPSGTCARPILRMLCASTCWISLSIKTIFPLLGWIRPDTVCSVVVLPAPFAPISVTISPCLTSKLTSLSAWMAS